MTDTEESGDMWWLAMRVSPFDLATGSPLSLARQQWYLHAADHLWLVDD